MGVGLPCWRFGQERGSRRLERCGVTGRGFVGVLGRRRLFGRVGCGLAGTGKRVGSCLTAGLSGPLLAREGDCGRGSRQIVTNGVQLGVGWVGRRCKNSWSCVGAACVSRFDSR